MKTNAKDIILLIAIIILIFVISQAKAQSLDDLRTQTIDIVLGARIEIVDSPRADNFTDYLMKAVSYDVRMFDNLFDAADCSWYTGIDVYLHDNPLEILDAIRLNDTANFRDTDVMRSSVSVATDGIYYLVIIASYP